LAEELKRRGVSVKVKRGGFFPEREQKSPGEVRKISAALMMAEVGMAEAMQLLRNSKIVRGGRLMHHNVPLTSEKLRSVIDTAIMQASGLATHTIVAGGQQNCDQHETGFGPLHAHEPIIIDIFRVGKDRLLETGWWHPAKVRRFTTRCPPETAPRRVDRTASTVQDYSRRFKTARRHGRRRVLPRTGHPGWKSTLPRRPHLAGQTKTDRR
jgi:hypothetical protein